MKKIILLVVVFGAIYFLYYAPEQFRKECLAQGGDFDSSTGNCRVDIDFTIEKEEWEKMLNEAKK